MKKSGDSKMVNNFARDADNQEPMMNISKTLKQEEKMNNPLNKDPEINNSFEKNLIDLNLRPQTVNRSK